MGGGCSVTVFTKYNVSVLQKVKPQSCHIAAVTVFTLGTNLGRRSLGILQFEYSVTPQKQGLTLPYSSPSTTSPRLLLTLPHVLAPSHLHSPHFPSYPISLSFSIRPGVLLTALWPQIWPPTPSIFFLCRPNLSLF